MYLDTETLFAAISTELGLAETRRALFTAFDLETGATIFFATLDELNAFCGGGR